MEGETRRLGKGRYWVEIREVGWRGRLFVVTGGTVGLAGDIVCMPGAPFPLASTNPVSPYQLDVVVDSVTRTVLLPESGRPASRLEKAMALVRLLEGAGLSDQAQIVRNYFTPLLEDELQDRRAA